MIVFFLIVNLLLIFKLAWDWYAKNKQKRIINHFRSALFDGLLYVVGAYLLFGFPELIGWVLVAAAYRWIFFDLFFNLLNGWDWDHYGESSAIDSFMTKTGKFHIIIKLTTLIISLCLTWILTNM